jgi:hypothetical protein
VWATGFPWPASAASRGHVRERVVGAGQGGAAGSRERINFVAAAAALAGWFAEMRYDKTFIVQPFEHGVQRADRYVAAIYITL